MAARNANFDEDSGHLRLIQIERVMMTYPPELGLNEGVFQGGLELAGTGSRRLRYVLPDRVYDRDCAKPTALERGTQISLAIQWAALAIRTTDQGIAKVSGAFPEGDILAGDVRC
jgi:hypothetical protein